MKMTPLEQERICTVTGCGRIDCMLHSLAPQPPEQQEESWERELYADYVSIWEQHENLYQEIKTLVNHLLHQTKREAGGKTITMIEGMKENCGCRYEGESRCCHENCTKCDSEKTKIIDAILSTLRKEL